MESLSAITSSSPYLHHQQTAFIAVGANLENPIDQCKQALCNLRLLPKTEIVRSSSFYLSEPLKNPQMQNQPVPSYINTVCQLKTDLPPEDLLTSLLAIEKKMGRVRREKWASRVIDLDLLFYGNRVMTSASLTLPHPQIQNRNFVLEPLCEIAEDWYHPVYHKTIRELASELPSRLQLHKLAMFKLGCLWWNHEGACRPHPTTSIAPNDGTKGTPI